MVFALCGKLSGEPDSLSGFLQSAWPPALLGLFLGIFTSYLVSYTTFRYIEVQKLFPQFHIPCNELVRSSAMALTPNIVGHAIPASDVTYFRGCYNEAIGSLNHLRCLRHWKRLKVDLERVESAMAELNEFYSTYSAGTVTMPACDRGSLLVEDLEKKLSKAGSTVKENPLYNLFSVVGHFEFGMKSNVTCWVLLAIFIIWIFSLPFGGPYPSK